MDFREIRFMEEREFQELKKVPEWARVEHMEMRVPLEELWKYPDSFAAESLLTNIFRRITGVRRT